MHGILEPNPTVSDRSPSPQLAKSPPSAKLVRVTQKSAPWMASMTRLSLFFSFSGILALNGCSHTKQEAATVPPPPGYFGGPVVAPVPSGCSSCGGSNPVVNAPRYSPPIPAAPPLVSNTPGLSLGTPVSAPPSMGPLQTAFKPYVPPIDARLGIIQVDNSPTIPLPPAENTTAE
jgi:hypothetical protein